MSRQVIFIAISHCQTQLCPGGDVSSEKGDCAENDPATPGEDSEQEPQLCPGGDINSEKGDCAENNTTPGENSEQTEKDTAMSTSGLCPPVTAPKGND